MPSLEPLVSRQSSRLGRWIPTQIRSTLASLMVKQVCESAPLVLLVLGTALTMSIGVTVVEQIERVPIDFWALITAKAFVVVACGGGFILAMLLGVTAWTTGETPGRWLGLGFGRLGRAVCLPG